MPLTRSTTTEGQSHRNLGRFESQASASGMIVDWYGSRGYRCNDIGTNSNFNKLVVRVEVR